MKVIFMGTPDFASGILREIHEAGCEVALVVTQPDKQKGRGKAYSFPPVKEAALDLGLEVFQPERIRNEENIEYLKKYEPDLIVVAAFGQILPKEILEMPSHCCLNVHASLLPKYRGASPIQQAIINGDKATGVTIMKMDEGLDTGDIFLQEEVPIADDETGGSLFDKLEVTGRKLITKAISKIEDGSATFTPQNNKEATYTRIIKKQDGEIDFTMNAKAIERLIRGMTPWPSAYTYLDGKMLKVWKAEHFEENSGKSSGTIFKANKEGIFVSTAGGTLIFREVQIEGKKRMGAEAFILGYPNLEGKFLG